MAVSEQGESGASVLVGQGSAQGFALPERYRLRRHLAAGGMASVWCAQDLALGRPVAIKVLADRFRHDPVAMRRFKREARAGARVANHPHVVTIFDVGDLESHNDEPPRPFIVMEYLSGGTVADALRVGSVGRLEALRWLREAASALDHAHALGIVHRDIKPANFLLDRGRMLHIADFGIARLVTEDTLSGAKELFGTAAYISPEQALGRDATSASDRYAFAVSAFELLTGERPFGAQHFAAQARQHVEEPPPRVSERDPSLAPALDAVLARALAKRPEDRFPTAGEFVAAIQAAMSAEPALAVRVHPIEAPEPAEVASEPVPAGVAFAPVPVEVASARVPEARRDHRVRRAAIAAGVAALLIAGALVAGLAGRTASPPRLQTAAAQRRHGLAAAATDHHPVGVHRNRPRPRPASTDSTVAATPVTTPVGPPTAQQLQLTGHQEMLAGDYQAAIATLRQAVAAAPAGSLTYAYALYDLGRALVMAGDPSAAVPILEQRLKIPNQTAVVRQALDQALQQSGQTPATAPTAETGSSSSTQSTITSPGKTEGAKTPGRTPPASPPASQSHDPSGGAAVHAPNVRPRPHHRPASVTADVLPA